MGETIWLRHEQHGVKHANLRDEADADIANGWEEFDPEAMPASAEPVPVAPQPKRRGRPPKLRE